MTNILHTTPNKSSPNCMLFPAGNHAALENAIESKVRDKLNLRQRVVGLTWEHYGIALQGFLERIK